jgi:hypothetical protein
MFASTSRRHASRPVTTTGLDTGESDLDSGMWLLRVPETRRSLLVAGVNVYEVMAVAGPGECALQSRERRYRWLRWLVAGGAGIQQMRLAGRRGMATMCKTLQSLYAVMRTILTILIIPYLARRTSSAKIHLVQPVESPSPECRRCQGRIRTR